MFEEKKEAASSRNRERRIIRVLLISLLVTVVVFLLYYFLHIYIKGEPPKLDDFGSNNAPIASKEVEALDKIVGECSLELLNEHIDTYGRGASMDKKEYGRKLEECVNSRNTNENLHFTLNAD